MKIELKNKRNVHLFTGITIEINLSESQYKQIGEGTTWTFTEIIDETEVRVEVLKKPE